MKLLSFEEFYNIKNNREFIEKFSSKIYHSEQCNLLRKAYELDDFINECIVDLIKYWHTYNSKYAYTTFVGNVIKSVARDLGEGLTADKRKIFIDDSNLCLHIGTDEGPELSEIVPAKDNYFSVDDFIIKACNSIEKKIDKQVNLLFYNGYTAKEISSYVGLTERQINYIIKKSKLILKEYYENYISFSS